jgi:hypothetical protein
MAGSLQPISSSWHQVPWDSRPETIFNWTLAVIVPMKHPLWRENGFVSHEYVWPFVKCTYRTYSMLLKILPFAPYTSPLVVEALRSRPFLSYVFYATTAAQSLEQSWAWPFQSLSLLYFWSLTCSRSSLHSLGEDHRKHRLSAVVPLLGVVAETCLPSSCLVVAPLAPLFRLSGVMSHYIEHVLV